MTARGGGGSIRIGLAPAFSLDRATPDATLSCIVAAEGADAGPWGRNCAGVKVELAVLAWIARGETYGYRIVEGLQRLDGLALTESTVYPALTRLARDGALAVRTEASPAGPTRRYYRLTTDGERRLRAMAEGWRAVSGSLSTLLEGAP